MITGSIDGSVPEIREDFIKTMLSRIGVYMLDSVIQNFMAGGRPTTWPAKKDGSPSFLQLGGDLLHSLLVSQDTNSVMVSTDVIYAMVHNYGGSIRTRNGGSFIMPKREFMMFQQEDFVNIGAIAGQAFQDSLVFSVQGQTPLPM